MNQPKELTADTTALFLRLWRDAPNWNGCAPFWGTKAERGNLTHLKRAKLITTAVDEGDTFVYFTDKGKELGARLTGRTEHGVLAEVTK